MVAVSQERLLMRSRGANGLPNGRLPAKFPAYRYRPPQTNFSCSIVKHAGFYADVETGCRVIRRCTMALANYMFTFVCPHGTVSKYSTGAKRRCDATWKNICLSVCLFVPVCVTNTFRLSQPSWPIDGSNESPFHGTALILSSKKSRGKGKITFLWALTYAIGYAYQLICCYGYLCSGLQRAAFT